MPNQIGHFATKKPALVAGFFYALTRINWAISDEVSGGVDEKKRHNTCDAFLIFLASMFVSRCANAIKTNVRLLAARARFFNVVTLFPVLFEEFG
jgi:hypothetical protein